VEFDDKRLSSFGEIAPEPGEGRPRLGTPPAPLSGTPEPTDPALAIESARYVAQMSGELASLPRGANLDLLAYFLDMARVEATSSIRKLDGRSE
jgi:hypothetical protein